MSLFHRRSEQRAVGFQDLWGSGHPASLVGSAQERALRLAPVYGAVRLLGDNVATMPFRAFRLAADGSTEKLARQPALLETPTQHGTVIDWRFRLVASLALRGNAYGLPTGYDATGRITQLEWLHPEDVSLYEDDVLVPQRWFVRGRSVDELVHIPWFVLPGKVLGLSPIGAFKTLIDTGTGAAEFGRDWFSGGSIPSAVLETDQPVNQEQALIIKARFAAATRGREPVVLGAGTKYRPITVPPDESQFLDTIRATATQVAAIFGVPADKIGGEPGGSMTYANVEQAALDFVTFTLRPYLVRIETMLTGLLPRPQIVKANADALIRADALTRYQAHHLALSDGWQSRDEIRRIEDLPPIPGGDQYAPIPTPAAPGPAIPPAGGDEA